MNTINLTWVIGDPYLVLDLWPNITAECPPDNPLRGRALAASLCDHAQKAGHDVRAPRQMRIVQRTGIDPRPMIVIRVTYREHQK